MRSSWQQRPLGELGDWGSGGTPLRAHSSYYGTGLPWLKIGDLTDGVVSRSEEAITDLGLANSSAKRIPPGVLLVAMYGSIGKLGVTEIECCTNQAIAFFVPGSNIDLWWTFWYLRSIRDELIRMGKGGAQSNISQTVLKALEVPVPPLVEQRRIVGRIHEFMGRVQEVHRLRGESREMASALDLAFLHVLEAGAGERMMEVADVVTGTRNGKSFLPNSTDANCSVLNLAAVREFALDATRVKPAVVDSATMLRCQVRRRDVFVSRANTLELVGLSSVVVDDVPQAVIFPDLLIKLDVDPAALAPEYLALALRFPNSRVQLRNKAKGSSQSMVKVSAADVRSVLIPVPPLAAQAEILARWDEFRDTRFALTGVLGDAAITALSLAILRKAFAGEL